MIERVLVAEMFPERSMLRTRIQFVPGWSVVTFVQARVPAAGIYGLEPVWTSTRWISKLSLAVPRMVVTGVVTRAPEDGATNATLGGVESGGLCEILKDWPATIRMAERTAVPECGPTVNANVPVPSKLVSEVTVTHAGMPVTSHGQPSGDVTVTLPSPPNWPNAVPTRESK